METLRPGALPPAVPDDHLAGTPAMFRAPRRWKVLHACRDAESVAMLSHAQAELGMRPALLTPEAWFNPDETAAFRLPLIHAWRDVRQWRAALAAETAHAATEIVHAHCFAAGMAAVRADLPLAYDLNAPIGAGSGAGPWLARSLRIAENFVLTRAGAVVVHAQAMWHYALAQGVRVEDLFLVPHPLAVPSLAADETRWLVALAGTLPRVSLFAAGITEPEALLRSFSIVKEEMGGAHLLVEHADAGTIAERAAKLGVSEVVHVVPAADRSRALAACDIAIAGAASTGPNPTALAAMSQGRALLAADAPCNREASPQGRGCLWYAPGSERDLAFRAAFLSRNPEFANALGAAGRAHVQATRSPGVVARSYDEVYRHALRRHRGNHRTHLHGHVPAMAMC